MRITSNFESYLEKLMDQSSVGSEGCLGLALELG